MGKARKFIKENSRKRSAYLQAILFAGIYFIFFINTIHEKYPDEFDNILGGRYILHGILPYSGFFSHHGPVGYFIAACIYLFSGQSFLKFRIFYSILLFFYFVFTYVFLKKTFGVIRTQFYLIFIFLFGISATYFWGHMLIADNLAAIFIVPVFALLLLKTVYSQTLERPDIVFISILSSLSLLSSISFVYFIGLIYMLTVYLYWKENAKHIIAKNTLVNVIILLAPYIVFFVYLVISGSLSEYTYQSIVFNKKYYVYYQGSSGEVTGNPIRLGIILLNQFYNNFAILLQQAFGFNFAFPVNITLAIADTALAFYLFFKRKFVFLVVFFFLLAFSSPRSNPLTTGERDYQAVVYLMLSILLICFLLPKFFSFLQRETDFAKRTIFTFFLFLLGLYAFYTFSFLFRNFETKAFAKYMGTAPIIYNRPKVAPLLNAITDKNTYVWIGPLEFEELLYLNRPIPSKYQFIIPAMQRSDKIKNEIVATYAAHKPDVIWFDNTQSILGSMPSKFAPYFMDFLHKNYIPVGHVKNGNTRFVVDAYDSSVDLGNNLYIANEKQDVITGRLLNLHVIRQVVENEKSGKTK